MKTSIHILTEIDIKYKRINGRFHVFDNGSSLMRKVTEMWGHPEALLQDKSGIVVF